MSSRIGYFINERRFEVAALCLRVAAAVAVDEVEMSWVIEDVKTIMKTRPPKRQTDLYEDCTRCLTKIWAMSNGNSCRMAANLIQAHHLGKYTGGLYDVFN